MQLLICMWSCVYIIMTAVSQLHGLDNQAQSDELQLVVLLAKLLCSKH